MYTFKFSERVMNLKEKKKKKTNQNRWSTFVRLNSLEVTQIQVLCDMWTRPHVLPRGNPIKTKLKKCGSKTSVTARRLHHTDQIDGFEIPPPPE